MTAGDAVCRMRDARCRMRDVVSDLQGHRSNLPLRIFARNDFTVARNDFTVKKMVGKKSRLEKSCPNMSWLALWLLESLASLCSQQSLTS